MSFFIAVGAGALRAESWITSEAPGVPPALSLPAAGSGQANWLVAGLVLGAVCLAVAGMLLRRKTRG